MIGSKTQPHCNAWAEAADFFELETADLNSHHIERTPFERLCGKRRTDVATRDRLHPGTAQHRFHQLCRSCLSVRPCDSHDGLAAKFIRHF